MEEIRLDRDWRFCKGDFRPKDPCDGWSGAKAGAATIGAAAPDLDDSGWERVDLPHDSVHGGEFARDLAAHDPMDDIPAMQSIRSRLGAGGFLVPEICWYRKRFRTEEDWTGQRLYLFFQGVYRKADIYLNGYYVGSLDGGYTWSCFDLTDVLLEAGGENVLSVRVDPTGREGWWYEGGGIYRHVKLLLCGDVHIPPYGLGVFPECGRAGDGRCGLRVLIRNDGTAGASGKLTVTAYDPEGKEAGKTCLEFGLQGLCETEAEGTLCLREPVRLWNTQDPALYTLKGEMTVRDENGKLCTGPVPDTVFGFRRAEFREDGFFLNGEKVPLRGFCAHQDHAGVGIGMPDSVLEYRLREMKKTGMNAFRSAHHQPSDELLDLCDRLGILVMSECRRMSSAEGDLSHLRKTVLQGRNHPCVVIWGIGNEEINVMHKACTAKTVERMKAEVRKLDTRPVTCAHVCWDGETHYDDPSRVYPVTALLDVMGFNYSIPAWDPYRAHFPEQPVLITEINAANSSTRGVFESDPAKGRFLTLDPSNAEKFAGSRAKSRFERGERDFMAVLERPWLCGSFSWTGIDYRGEPTPLDWPAVSSQFGVLDLCGFPKDSFWFYKSFWTGEDVLHLFPHWNRAGHEGECFSLYAYTNAEKTELFVNGKSLGEGTRRACGYVEWPGVVYEPGEVTVLGWRQGRRLTDRMETTGPFCRLESEIYNENRFARQDALIVQVRAVDDKGRFVPDACPAARIVPGKGTTVLGHGNGDPGCHEKETGEVFRLFNGRAQIILRCEGEPSYHLETIG